jgi:hypothetical protein
MSKPVLHRVSERNLRKQYDQVIREGWLAFFEDAATEFFPKGEYDAADLIAIASRETNLNKKYLREAGDHGNGFGLMQADRRSFLSSSLRARGAIRKNSIRMGAKVLSQKLKDTRACEGRQFTVKNLAGGVYTCPSGKHLTERERYRVALSAYNCGRWAHYHASKGRDVDYGSTDKDYSLDVAARAVYVREWITSYMQPKRACARCC